MFTHGEDIEATAVQQSVAGLYHSTESSRFEESHPPIAYNPAGVAMKANPALLVDMGLTNRHRLTDGSSVSTLLSVCSKIKCNRVFAWIFVEQ